MNYLTMPTGFPLLIQRLTYDNIRFFNNIPEVSITPQTNVLYSPLSDEKITVAGECKTVSAIINVVGERVTETGFILFLKSEDFDALSKDISNDVEPKMRAQVLIEIENLKSVFEQASGLPIHIIKDTHLRLVSLNLIASRHLAKNNP